jgi:D-alanyl-D-alanine carboxypeptidase
VDGQVLPVDITEFNPSAVWAAGEIISTAADLNRFFAALAGGRLLGEAELREMTSVDAADLEVVGVRPRGA